MANDSNAAGEQVLVKLEGLGYRFHREGSLEPFKDRHGAIGELRAMKRCANSVALPSAA